MGKKLRERNQEERARELEHQEYLRMETEGRSRTHRFGLILGFIVFILYFLTLFPTVPGGDSGELIAAVKVLGVAHPPGYPLFTLLGKLFSFIPHGTIAWRVNLMSAAFDAAAVVLIYLTTIRWTLSIAAGILAGGLFAFSPLVWTYATQAEVFPINNFFAAALLFCSVSYWKLRQLKFVQWGALLLGLGLCNHHTLIFFGFPLIIWILCLGHRELLSGSKLLKLALLFFAPLLLYLYLPWAASRLPIISWGDFSTLNGFLAHLLRKDYGTFQLGSDGNEGVGLFYGLGRYFASLPKEFLYLGPLLAAVGAWSSFRREREFGFFKITLFLFCFYLVVFHSLENLPLTDPLLYGIVIRFWQMPNILICIWAGAGLVFVFEVIKRPEKMAAIFALLAVLIQVGIHYQTLDQHQNWIFERFGRAILEPLPQNAILLTRGDIYTNATRYLQQCEGVRPDVKILDREMLSKAWTTPVIAKYYPEIVLPGIRYRYKKGEPGSYDLSDLINANGQFPIFLVSMHPDEDHQWDQNSSWPFLLVNWVVTPVTPFDLQKYLKDTENAYQELHLSTLPKYDPTTWEYFVVQHFWEIEQRRGTRLMTYGIATGNIEIIRDSSIIFQRLLDQSPAPELKLYKNLGYAYSHLPESENKHKMAEIWGKYLNLQNTDPDNSTIRQAVESVSKNQ